MGLLKVTGSTNGRMDHHIKVILNKDIEMATVFGNPKMVNNNIKGIIS